MKCCNKNHLIFINGKDMYTTLIHHKNEINNYQGKHPLSKNPTTILNLMAKYQNNLFLHQTFDAICQAYPDLYQSSSDVYTHYLNIAKKIKETYSKKQDETQQDSSAVISEKSSNYQTK